MANEPIEITPQLQREADEAIEGMGRAARRWFQSDFFDTVEYESDVDYFLTTHPSWCTGEADMRPLGVAVYRTLKTMEAA